MVITNIEKITGTLPVWFKHDMSRFDEFADIIADFEVPSNKQTIFEGRVLKGSSKNPSYKGWKVVNVTAANSLGLPVKAGTKTVETIYDQTFDNVAIAVNSSYDKTNLGIGASVAYHWDLAEDDTIAANIANEYLSILSNAVDYTFINGEFIRKSNNTLNFCRVINQIAILSASTFPNKKFGWWDLGYYTGHPYWSEGIPNALTNNDWRQHYISPVPNNYHTYPYCFENFGVSMIDGYATDRKYPASQTYIHFQAHEVGNLLNKVKPLSNGKTREHLTVFWEMVETAESKVLNVERIVPNVGKKTFISRHPKSTLQCYNEGLYHTTALNGIYNWGERPPTVKDKTKYVVDDNDNVPSAEGGYYPIKQRLQALYLKLGMWYSSIPKVKSIIETDNENWEMPDFNYKGINVTGNEKFPSYSRPQTGNPYGHPIVRLKFNSARNKALVLVNYPLNPSFDEEVSININHPELLTTVKTKGGKAELYYFS